MLYERYHTRDIAALGGLARRLPVLAFFFLVVTLSSIGLPGLNGFIGEFLVLVGMFAGAAGLRGAGGGAASSWARSTCCGWCSGCSSDRCASRSTATPHVTDLGLREILALAPIVGRLPVDRPVSQLLPAAHGAGDRAAWCGRWNGESAEPVLGSARTRPSRRNSLRNHGRQSGRLAGELHSAWTPAGVGRAGLASLALAAGPRLGHRPSEPVPMMRRCRRSRRSAADRAGQRDVRGRPVRGLAGAPLVRAVAARLVAGRRHAGRLRWQVPLERPLLVANDPLARFGTALALATGVAMLLLSTRLPERETAGEYFASLLLVVAGGMLVAKAQELIVLFLGLELISIPTYVLLYLARQDAARPGGDVEVLLPQHLLVGPVPVRAEFRLRARSARRIWRRSGDSAAGDRGAAPTVLIALTLIAGRAGASRWPRCRCTSMLPDVYQGTRDDDGGGAGLGAEGRGRVRPAADRGLHAAGVARPCRLAAVAAGRRHDDGGQHAWACCRTTCGGCWPTPASPTPATC